MTSVKLFRCEGCGEWLDEIDVSEFHGTLAHEYPAEDGEPMPCGPVHEVHGVHDSQEGKVTE